MTRQWRQSGWRRGEEPTGPVLDESAGVGEDHLALGVLGLHAGEHVGDPGPAHVLELVGTRVPSPDHDGREGRSERLPVDGERVLGTEARGEVLHALALENLRPGGPAGVKRVAMDTRGPRPGVARPQHETTVEGEPEQLRSLRSCFGLRTARSSEPAITPLLRTRGPARRGRHGVVPRAG